MNQVQIEKVGGKLILGILTCLTLVNGAAVIVNEKNIYNCRENINILCKVASCGSVSLHRNNESATDCLKNDNVRCRVYLPMYSYSCDSDIWTFSKIADETDDGVVHRCTNLLTHDVVVLTSIIKKSSCGTNSTVKGSDTSKWYVVLVLLYIPFYCGICVAIVHKCNPTCIKGAFIKDMYDVQYFASVICCIIRIERLQCQTRKDPRGESNAAGSRMTALLKNSLCFFVAITPLSVGVYIWYYVKYNANQCA